MINPPRTAQPPAVTLLTATLCALLSPGGSAQTSATTTAPIYRTQTLEYHNRDHYRQGLVISSEVADASGAVFTRTQTDYRVVRVSDQTEIPAASLSTPPGSPAVPGRQDRLFVQTVAQTRFVLEGQALPGQGHRTQLAYDALGNVTAYCDLGDLTGFAAAPAPVNGLGNGLSPGFTAEDRTRDDTRCASIDYADDTAAHIVGIPTAIAVYTGAQTRLNNPAGGTGAGAAPLQRQRLAQIEPTTGNLLAVHACRLADDQARADACTLATVAADSTLAESTQLAYHPDGTLKSVRTAPGYTVHLAWEPITRSHVASVRDSFNERSSTGFTADTLRFGLPASQTDLNGHVVSYTYDAFARPRTVVGPYEQGSGRATLTMDYVPQTSAGRPAHAITRHLDIDCAGPAAQASFDRAACLGDYRSDTIDTVTFVDGLGRMIQTKRDMRFDGQGGADGRSVSGRVIRDAFGRSVAVYHPKRDSQAGSSDVAAATFDAGFDAIAPTTTAFDILDRPTQVTLPDGAVTTRRYGFGVDANGLAQASTEARDALGVRSWTYNNARGLTTARYTFDRHSNQETWTRYHFDALDQLSTVIDAEHHLTTAGYDRLGRRTLLNNPDTGTVQWGFDALGRLASRTRPDGQVVTYGYAGDTAAGDDPVTDPVTGQAVQTARLTRITHPPAPSDRDPVAPAPIYPSTSVTLAYGQPGDSTGGIGRVVRTTHQAGETQRFYGKLGELIIEVQLLDAAAPPAAPPGSAPPAPHRFVTRTIYDSFGRLRQVQLPDVIRTSANPTAPDPQDAPGERLTYGYDAGGLLASVVGFDDPPAPNADLPAGPGNVDPPAYRYTYLTDIGYDAFGQRTRQTYGTAPGATSSGVTETFVYDPARRWLDHKQASDGLGTSNPATSRFQDLRYSFDAVGNIRHLTNFAQTRNGQPLAGPTTQRFDYDDYHRLIGASGQHSRDLGQAGQTQLQVHTYSLQLAYDRIHNLTHKTRHVRLDNQAQAQTSLDWAYRYLSHRPHAPTHIGTATYQYDAAGNRIHWAKQDANATPMHAVWDTDDQLQALYAGADPYDTTAPAPPALAEYRYDDAGTRKIKRAAAAPDTSAPGVPPSAPSTDTPGDVYTVNAWYTVQIPQAEPGGINTRKRNIYIMDGARRIAAKINTPSTQCGAQTPNQQDPYTVYTYHTDHLGSTSYLTNKCAQLIEHTEYFPFGQPWVDESTYDPANNPQGTEAYKYTGKQLDQESGLYYYGARYYEPDTGIWLSADPILSDYMDGFNGGVFEPKNLGLYTQSYNNPIVYFDPDGRYSGHINAPGNPGSALNVDIAPPSSEELAQRERFESRRAAATTAATILNPGAGISTGTLTAATGRDTQGDRVGPVGRVFAGVFAAVEAVGLKVGASGRLFGRTGPRSLGRIIDIPGLGNFDLTERGVGSFMDLNAKRINQKLGRKIGKGDISAFSLGLEGIQQARSTVEQTLLRSTDVTPAFKAPRGQNQVFDVYSADTGFTVRVRADGTFETLIQGPSQRARP